MVINDFNRPSPMEPAAFAAGVVAEWPHVHIGEVETIPTSGGGEPAALVRARVHLGALTPADVKVELTTREPLATERHVVPRRLWSMHPYHNDAYEFETRIPLRVLGRREGCVIEVTPAEDLPEGVSVEPAVEPVGPPPGVR